jgi:hypothetical protein
VRHLFFGAVSSQVRARAKAAVRACVTTHLCVCGISMGPLGVGRMCACFSVCAIAWVARFHFGGAFLCFLSE